MRNLCQVEQILDETRLQSNITFYYSELFSDINQESLVVPKIALSFMFSEPVTDWYRTSALSIKHLPLPSSSPCGASSQGLTHYGLGLAELLPLKKGKEAISEYVAKCLEAGPI